MDVLNLALIFTESYSYGEVESNDRLWREKQKLMKELSYFGVTATCVEAINCNNAGICKLSNFSYILSCNCTNQAVGHKCQYKDIDELNNYR